MTYREWRALVARMGWTLAQVRGDVPPTAELFDAMDRVGFAAWERYVLRLEEEACNVDR